MKYKDKGLNIPTWLLFISICWLYFDFVIRSLFLSFFSFKLFPVNFAIPTGYKDDQDVWKYIDISEADIDTFFFDLPPLEETSCLYLEFGIKADRDALLILSPYNEVDDNSYEIGKYILLSFFTCKQ